MADRRLLMEYVLDDLGRIKSSKVLDKTPDVSYEEVAGVAETESKARDVSADLRALAHVDPSCKSAGRPIVGVRADGSVAAWDYEECPMAMVVCRDHSVRGTVAKNVVASLPGTARAMWAKQGDEQGMVAEVQTIMMSRYERLEDAGKNSWSDVPEYGSRGGESIVLVVDVDKFPFRPDVDSMVGSIARLGRAAGIHLLLLLSTAAGMPGELKENIGLRMLVGKSTMADSARVLDSKLGTMLPDDLRYAAVKVWDDEGLVRLADVKPAGVLSGLSGKC